MTLTTVVFDIGGVLVNWQPHSVWLGELGSHAAVEAFLSRIDFRARNLRADAGERFADLAAELDDPEDGRRLMEYVSRYQDAVREPVAGTWAIVDRLCARRVPLHAITNWSAETWPEAIKAQPRLAEVFDAIVVSGEVRMLKPDPRIYRLLCDRAGVRPTECVFVDDSAVNAEGARAAGMDAIHFTGAAALETALAQRGLL